MLRCNGFKWWLIGLQMKSRMNHVIRHLWNIKRLRDEWSCNSSQFSSTLHSYILSHLKNEEGILDLWFKYPCIRASNSNNLFKILGYPVDVLFWASCPLLIGDSHLQGRHHFPFGLWVLDLLYSLVACLALYDPLFRRPVWHRRAGTYQSFFFCCISQLGARCRVRGKPGWLKLRNLVRLDGQPGMGNPIRKERMD